MLFLRIFQHLLPRSRAWSITVDKTLRKFFVGLAEFATDPRDKVDEVWADLLPESTTEIEEWEKQHGVVFPSSSESQRRDALAVEWESQGGQSLAYIQGLLRDAGFDVYLHPFWRQGRTPYDLTGAVYSGKSFDTSTQTDQPSSIAFGDHGAKMYVLDGGTGGTDDVVEYSLSTLYDVSTATATGETLDVGAKDPSPNGLRFKPDGTQLFVIGNTNDKVYAWSLSTAWDLSTATFEDESPSVNSEESAPQGLAFSSDGTKFYVVGSISGTVYQYTLSTAWDVTTASYASKSKSVSSEDSFPISVTFDDDGDQMFVLGITNDAVFIYDLSTAWDVSTATLSDSFDVSGESGNGRGIAFGGNGGLGVGYDNGTRLFVVASTGTVFQYSVADFLARDPTDLLDDIQLGTTQCGEPLAQCGEPDAVCNTTTVNTPGYIVNLDLTSRAPPLLPTDSAKFPYFFYIGGETFGDSAVVEADRQRELERLLMKLKPTQQWIGLFLDYADPLVTESSDQLVTESGDRLFA